MLDRCLATVNADVDPDLIAKRGRAGVGVRGDLDVSGDWNLNSATVRDGGEDQQRNPCETKECIDACR
jgi:hypothetical protein